MRIQVELKTKMYNDTNDRMADNNLIKEAIDKYSVGFNGIVIYHESLYDYNYDTKDDKYNKVDSIGAFGSIESSIIEDDKLYLVIDANRNVSSDSSFICFFRASLQSDPKTKTSRFDNISIFAVDMVNVTSNDNVNIDDLSEVILLEK